MPGVPVRQVLKITPKEVFISVLTKVEGAPTKNVRVWLYETTYGVAEELEERKSGENRKAEFMAFKGQRVFVKARFKDEEGFTYGPAFTDVFVVENDLDMEMDLSQVRNGISFSIEGNSAMELTTEKMYNGKLEVGLPFADARTEKKYDRVVVEMWAGEPGTKQSPRRTPVLIAGMDPYLFSSQPLPVIKPEAYDSFDYDGSADSGDLDTTSKYVKFIISDYEAPSSYIFNIPMFARKLASGNATILESDLANRSPWR